MPGKIPNEKKRKELVKECKSIRKSIESLKLLMPDDKATRELRKISKKFEGIAGTWQNLSSFTNESIQSDKVKASKLLRSMKVSRKVLIDVQKDKKRIKSQEVIQRKKELRLGKSLGRIKGLWQESLTDMESSLKMQRDALSRISQEYFSAMKKIDHEINDVLQNPSVPALNLDKISHKKSNSKKPSSRITSNCRSSQDDFISNRSAFSIFTEGVSSFRSLSTNNKKKSDKKGNRNNEKIGSKLEMSSKKENKEEIVIVKGKDLDEDKRLNTGTDSRSYENLSEISKQENLTESVSLQDIKEALFILKKANLINNSGNSQLMKIAEMIKDPENTSNIELMLQLIEIENRKSKCPSDRNKSKRPSNPRIKIKKSKVAELVDTSREKFRFSEEKSFNRTLLSNEFLLSPKNYDEGIDFIFSGKEELTDVKLEDLLNVNSLIEDLGLVSADNSLLNLNEIHTATLQYDDETSREKEISSQYDHIPVKISKK